MLNTFSEAFAKRIITAVEYVERLMRSAGGLGSGSRADGVFVPVQVQADLYESNEVSAKVLTPSSSSAPYTLTASNEVVKVVAWEFGSDKYLPNGGKCWAMWWGGRLYAGILADCLEDVP